MAKANKSPKNPPNEPPFFSDIKEDGYHIYSLKNAKKSNYYPSELPEYPGVVLKDIKEDDANFDIITEPNDFDEVKETIETTPVEILSAEITMVPGNYVNVEANDVKKLLRLLDDLENHDDVQNIHGNFDIDESLLVEE